MPSVNIRQLRDTRQLKAWLKAGKTVELRERDRILGRIVPESSREEPRMWPDFAARMQGNFRRTETAGCRFDHKGARPLLTSYADTSFFVSLYLPDRHSTEAQRRMAQRPRLWLTPLHQAEWAHAVFQHVFQRKISSREAQHVSRLFEHDREIGLWVEVSLPEPSFETCAELARRHAARLGTRTLDSLHVASALELNAETFWTFDDRQAKLAKAEGLKTS